MKKMLFVLLALCLFVVPAMAQTQDNPEVINWEDLEEALEKSPYGGRIFNNEFLGISYFVPNGLNQVELTEEQNNDGIMDAYVDETGTIQELFILRQMPFSTLEEFADFVSENSKESKVLGYYKINGFDALMIVNGETEEMITVINTTTEGYFIQVSLKPMSQESVNAISGFVFGSITPYSAETENEN